MPLGTKEEQREYQRKWWADRRLTYFADKECTRCGSKMNLRIHHVDKTIKESHKIWSWCDSRREAELAKCIVLCDRCHKIEHGYVEDYHGTTTGYTHRGCRCILCKKAKAKRDANYRLRKKEQLS